MDVGGISSLHQQFQFDLPFSNGVGGARTSQATPSGQQSQGMGMTGANKVNEEGTGRSVQYSMPGILHFLQTEWARFEMDRAQWEVDRAEFQVGHYLTNPGGKNRIVPRFQTRLSWSLGW